MSTERKSLKRAAAKVSATVVAACLAFSMLPAMAFAEVATLADGPVSGTVEVDENWTLAYTVEDGEATIDYAASFPEKTANLTIPATVPDPDDGDDVPVTGIGANAFFGNADNVSYHEGGKHLAAVTLPDSVRYIEQYAFRTTSMTSITIGSDIAYIATFGIANNEELISVEFASGASPEFFGDYAFAYDEALPEFSIPPLTGSEFHSMWSYRLGDYCFAECSSLETIIFEAGSPTGGDDYAYANGYGDGHYFDGCTSLTKAVIYLDSLNSSVKMNSATKYYPVYFYPSQEACEEDSDRVDTDKVCVLLRSGTSFTDISAGTVGTNYFYTDRAGNISNGGEIPTVSGVTKTVSDLIWGFGDNAINSSGNGGGMGPNSTSVSSGSLGNVATAYPVSRADMDYAFLVLGGSHIETTQSGFNSETSSVYYLYSTGVDLSGITAYSPDGQEVDRDLYQMVYTGSDGTEYTDDADIDTAGSYSAAAHGVGEYSETKTSSRSFRIVKHTATTTSFTSGTDTHAAAEAAYQMADADLSDPAFVVMAPASDWRACMVATALAGSGEGLAVFSDGTADDDTLFQAILRARVDHITFVGSTSAIGTAAIERAKILVNDEDGAFNYFDISDASSLALSVCETVRESGPEADNPHEWGDTAILMSPSSCLYTASVAQYAYAAAAPVLYTASDGSVSSSVASELAHFKKVVVAGDEDSVPASTLSSLEASGTEVVRVCDEGQAYASSVGVTEAMQDDLSATMTTISVADASSPSCVMTACQLSAVEGGICYACSASAETKACQKALYDADACDTMDAAYVVGPFASDSGVSSRMADVAGGKEMADSEFSFVPGDTFEEGGLVFETDPDGKESATLSSVADVSLTDVNAATATYDGTAYTVDTLAASALAGNKQITSVTLGNIPSVPANACKNCTALKTVSFAAATKMAASSFAGCTSLTSVSIPKVASIPAASFKGLKKLSGVTAGSATSIGASAFQNCGALKSADFAAAKTIGSSSFAGCTSLTSVKLSKVTSIPASAFAGDKKLKSASFGTVTSIGASAFSGCAALTSAPVAKATSVGASAFAGCSSLKSVTASSAKTIGASAFKGAKKLTKANLSSKKLKSIGANAFSGCKKLKKVTIKSTKLKKVGKKAFKGCAKKMTVKVPKAKVKKYSKLLSKAGISKKAKVKA